LGNSSRRGKKLKGCALLRKKVGSGSVRRYLVLVDGKGFLIDPSYDLVGVSRESSAFTCRKKRPGPEKAIESRQWYCGLQKKA